MIGTRTQTLQLQNGSRIALDEYGDPIGPARIFLSRLAELAHDGRARAMKRRAISVCGLFRRIGRA